MTLKNGKIELMRFIFSICVVLLHLNNDWWNATKLLFGSETWSLCKRGNMGVEFFFLVSGFLMAQSISKKIKTEKNALDNKSQIPSLSIADETLSFLWKKIKSFLPYHCIFYFMAIIVFVLQKPDNLIYKLLQYIPSFFLLHKTGLYGSSLMGVEWYLSTMLLWMAILYPIVKRFYNSFTHLYGPISAIFVLGWLYQEWGKLNDQNAWNGFTYYSTLRAYAELTIGMSCYEICSVLKSRTFSKAKRIMVSILEGGCYLYALRYMFSTTSSKMDFICMFSLAIAITLSFSQQGILSQSKLFQNKLCYLMGALSLPIYLAQNPIRSMTKHLLNISRPRDGALLTLVLILISASIAYVAVEKWKKHRCNSAKH